VITGMEQQGAGVLIPARITSKGDIDGRSSVANLAQMGVLKRYIQKLISEMAENLYNGKIAAQPVDGGGYAPCAYCPYTAVCGHEKEDKKRDVTAIDKEALFEMLKAEEGEKE
ncbi:MAG: PD-(D/E)XK nuclease family protein, partial [Oscillospiraceae bacterium]